MAMARKPRQRNDGKRRSPAASDRDGEQLQRETQQARLRLDDDRDKLEYRGREPHHFGTTGLSERDRYEPLGSYPEGRGIDFPEDRGPNAGEDLSDDRRSLLHQGLEYGGRQPSEKGIEEKTPDRHARRTPSKRGNEGKAPRGR
ncbi:MAG: hypothetical protein HY078_11760 [Elusimicrobia bacterium]|nr:hypothetical protein [Elusimicrobiota bacterium]